MEQLRVLCFGDQSSDFRPIIRRVSQEHGNPLLEAFLERSSAALRSEVAREPRSEQQQIAGFTSILDLVERYTESKSPVSSTLETALTCVAQIACFISYQGASSAEYPTPHDSYIVGSCTGLLAAAAVSSCRSLVDLLPVAIETVRTSYHIGSLVGRAANNIDQSCDGSRSWALAVNGLSEEQLVDRLNNFHSANNTPLHSHAYISATSSNGFTVSGPPRVLHRLLESRGLSTARTAQLPIYGPFHAGHVHSKDDLGSLYDEIEKSRLTSRVPRIKISSTNIQQPLNHENLSLLLRSVAENIILHQLCWEHVLQETLSVFQDHEATDCQVVCFGSSATGQSLVSALKQGKSCQITLDDQYVIHSNALEKDGPALSRRHSKIAICGLAGRFPDAADHEAFWSLLEQGLDLHREVPKDRFDVTTHVDVDGKRTNTSHTPYGCFIKEPGLFDPRFFNISPREAAQIDPMQRLALVTAYEALEMSGYVANRTPSTQLDRIGTFYGQTSDDWREIQAAQKVDTYFIPGGVRAFAPGRINYHFKFSGPSFSIDTACSSSLAAIQLACTSLWAGDCDTAVAGGMNVLTNPDIFSGLSRGQFLSKKGPCATFDDDADGYCRADGVGTVILKRLEDAQADKDPILGVILGAATNHSAEAVSITHPHAGAQEFLYGKILNASGTDPHDISYVEMHGTGTQAGDATEMRSVLNTFAPEKRRRRPDQTLYLGAVKSNAGHGEAASGITSLIKLLTMMDKSMIPPHCGIKGKINHNFPKDMAERNIHIASQPVPWTRKNGGKRMSFLNNFSAAGGNTALLLEDGPLPGLSETTDPRSTHVFAVSGRSKKSLRDNIEALMDFLRQHPDAGLPDLSYTATARRIQHNHRITVSASEMSNMMSSLSSALDRDVSPVPPTGRKIAFLFTGQGCQYVNMAKALFDSLPVFRSKILQFEQIAKIQGLPSILGLIDGSVTNIEELSPVVVQLGSVCVQMALYSLWTSWGIKPTAVLGHSLGEYAALQAAGVLSVADTIYLVGRRAQLLVDKCHPGSHAMLAVKGSIAGISEALDEQTLEIACINGPEETVVSGTNVNIDLFAADLKDRGFKCTKLAVPYAYHSAQVEAILDGYESLINGVAFNSPTIPVISPLLAEVVTDGDAFSPTYLRRHCRETVNFLGGIEAARHANLVADKSIWLEVGAHPICSTMIRATLGPHVQTAASLKRNDDDWKTLTAALCLLHDAGVDVDWKEYHSGFESSLSLLRLPTYRWDNKDYWIEYTNNWTLAKGDPGLAAQVEAAKPKFAGSSVHNVVEQDLQAENPIIVTETDLTDPFIKEVIDGHEVNGFGLCPPSLYADMALTVADYVWKEVHTDGKHINMNTCDMKVEKPLMVNEEGPQMLCLSGTFDKSSNKIDFEIFSVNSTGEKTITHATCGVKFEDSAGWITGWERSTYMVKSRIESLLDGVQNGNNDLIRRGMAYKLFGGLINYGHKYRGMEEVALDNSQLEATASVQFQTNGSDEKFLFSPYRIDSVAHLSGFIMLGNENADTSKEVYVSHGWENCRFARPLSVDKKYRSYVKMQHEGAKVVVGDVYVFEGETVVGVVEGLRFHCIPRQLMDSILSAAGGKGKAPKPAPAPIVTQPAPKPKAKANAASKPAPVASPVSTANSNGVTSQAMRILAAEIGIPESNLTDHTAFAEMGVDSLLALNISGKFREDLGVDTPSSLFLDYPTVKDLKAFLGENDTPTPTINTATPSTTAPSSGGSSERDSSPSSSMSSATDVEETPPMESGDSSKTVELIRTTIAEETGVAASEIEGSTDLAGLGMDSLMSLTIMGKLRENTSEELPSDFFATNTTMDAIEGCLGVQEKPKHSESKGEKRTSRRQDLGPEEPSNTTPHATSILLQGSADAEKALFLFPDGSGSATSYSTLPRLASTSSLAVYALNSPFLKSPSSHPPSISSLTSLYLQEIRRRRPHGPYMLGGWSAGGVIAYEAFLQLHSAGEVVERLILIDAPCPLELGMLPSGLHEWFNDQGILLGQGDKNSKGTANRTPEWLIPHFDATVRALASYQPVVAKDALSAADAIPRTYMVWAKDGVCKFPTDPVPPTPKGDASPMGMRFLLENREGGRLKYGGWERLLGEEAIVETGVVEGVNHFSLMGDGAGRLGELVGGMVM